MGLRLRHGPYIFSTSYLRLNFSTKYLLIYYLPKIYLLKSVSHYNEFIRPSGDTLIFSH